MTRTKTATRNQDMRTKSSKTGARVKINTCLLLFLAAFFGVITYCGISRLRTFNISATAFTISDGPNLCRKNETNLDDHTFHLDDVYLCSLEQDENGNFAQLTDPSDYALYLNNQITWASEIKSAQLKVMLGIIGSMFTLSALVGAIVYWNHNRDQ